MRVLGYSERGLVNSLLYTVGHHPEAQPLIKRLFDMVHWPQLSNLPAATFSRCETVIIEQSFSDFGDADAVLLFDGGQGGSTVFLEAKRGPEFRLATEWRDFKMPCKMGTTCCTSNLFCQLYFKQRLASALANPSRENIAAGLRFQPNLGLAARDRQIGANRVVLRAVETIRPRIGNVFFLLMIPDKWGDDLNQWWVREASELNGCLAGWDATRWGILTLPEVHQFCRETNLVDVLVNFAFNEGQLY